MSIVDKSKLSGLVERYANLMMAYAYSYCKNRADAEDIIQEVFVKYLKRLPKFKDDNHEKAWFLRVTINTSKDYINSFWYRKTEALNESISFEKEDDLNVWEQVMKLPQKYKIVILLFYQDGYSIKEISSILKIRESTVATQLNRGRELLKIMNKEDFYG